MRMANANQRPKRRVRFRFFVYLFLVVLVYAGFSLFSQWREMRRLLAEREALEQRLEAAVLSMDKLKNLIEIADTDAYIESIARDKLGWVKPGETRYKIRDK
jgi:cell division protein FtsB